MRLHFFALAGLLALALAPPAIAADVSAAFHAPARSGELCSISADLSAADISVALAPSTEPIAAPATIEPSIYLALANSADSVTFSPAAPAPFDPGRTVFA